MKSFAEKIITWHKLRGRHNLPWQQSISPYRVWVSEIMLQQTQVKTVIPYYQRFIQRFKNLKSLAIAQEDEVLNYWSGLGYYARARNLHRCAKIIFEQYHSRFPKTIPELCKLPGIGRSTAGAILSLAMNQFAPILDGNVKRILSRVHAIEGWIGDPTVLNNLWKLSEQLTPKKKTAIYNQAMMDIGATICTRHQPKCLLCPINKNCRAYQQNQIHLFPTPKPRKILPSKKIKMIIFVNEQGEILLEKRPPMGIWGGLWSLPECDEQQDIQQWAKQNFFFDITEPLELTSISHQFSHFRLFIFPFLIKINSIQSKIMEKANYIWYKESNNLQIGKAKPIDRLLKNLFAGDFYESKSRALSKIGN